MSREKFVAACRSQIGKPYIYGGNGPDTFDCSGFILWAFRQADIVIGDMAAYQIYNRFKRNAASEISLPGQLVFYGGDTSSITHVMACLEMWGPKMPLLIGARGGTSTTTTIADAYRRGAYVGVTPGWYWEANRCAIVDPWG
jgi:hypothetical protein